MPPTVLRRPARVALFASLGVLAACELPTIPKEAPILQQTWVVPGDSLSIGVSDLLPAGVVVSGGATPVFTITTPAANINTTLGAVCGQAACQTGGATVSAPVPGFTSPAGLLSSTVNFPAGVNSATVTGGALNLAVTNNLGFDLLRPNGAGTAPYGSLSVTVTSGTTTSTTVINGSPAQGVPNGATTNLQVTLPTGSYTASVAISMSLVVPAGGTASLNSNNSLGIVGSLQNFAVSQANVAVTNAAINTTPTDFDLEEVDFADMVEGGGLLLEFVNPLTATAAINVVITAPPQAPIIKAINVAASSTSNGSVTLTKAELQSLLGKPNVTISVTGAATGTGAGNSVTVTPTSQITVRTQLQLILNVGA